MEGGIKAWKGLVAEGAPESGMAYFSPATKPEELIALAWSLEDGSHKFYSELAGSEEIKRQRSPQRSCRGRATSSGLASQALQGTFGKLSDSEFMGPGILVQEEEGDVMEGGIRVRRH